MKSVIGEGSCRPRRPNSQHFSRHFSPGESANTSESLNSTAIAFRSLTSTSRPAFTDSLFARNVNCCQQSDLFIQLGIGLIPSGGDLAMMHESKSILVNIGVLPGVILRVYLVNPGRYEPFRSGCGFT